MFNFGAFNYGNLVKKLFSKFTFNRLESIEKSIFSM